MTGRRLRGAIGVACIATLIAAVPITTACVVTVGTQPTHVPEAASAARSEVTVDDDAPADFTSINAAVQAAPSGSIVRVRAGTYRELVELRSGITIVGAGRDQTTVEYLRGDAVMHGQRVDSVRVQGLRLQHERGEAPCGSPVVLVQQSSNVMIEDCEILGSGYEGVLLERVTGAGIVGSRIADNEWAGVELLRSTAITLLRDELVGNGVGLAVGGSAVGVRDCTFGGTARSVLAMPIPNHQTDVALTSSHFASTVVDFMAGPGDSHIRSSRNECAIEAFVERRELLSPATDDAYSEGETPLLDPMHSTLVGLTSVTGADLASRVASYRDCDGSAITSPAPIPAPEVSPAETEPPPLHAATTNGRSCSFQVPTVPTGATRVVLIDCAPVPGRSATGTRQCSERFQDDIVRESSGPVAREHVFVCPHPDESVAGIVVLSSAMVPLEGFVFDIYGELGEVDLVDAVPGSGRQIRVLSTDGWNVTARILTHTSRGLSSVWEEETRSVADDDTLEAGYHRQEELVIGVPESGTVFTRVTESSEPAEVASRSVTLYRWSPASERFEGPTTCPDPAPLVAAHASTTDGRYSRLLHTPTVRLTAQDRRDGWRSVAYETSALAWTWTASGCPALLVRTRGLALLGPETTEERGVWYSLIDIDPRTGSLRALERDIAPSDARIVGAIGIGAASHP